MRQAAGITKSAVNYVIFARHNMRGAAYAGLIAVAASFHAIARADSINAVYHGHDLGLKLHDALAEVQGTGASRASHVTLGISGSGDQLMFTEINADVIETETASYKDLEFNDIDVRKVGDVEGRYGITLHAAAGSVNDHIVSLAGGGSAAPGRDAALGYLDFWLVDPEMKRIRHLADLLATIGARLGEEQGQTMRAPAMADAAVATPVRAIAEHIEEAPDSADKMPSVEPAPRIPVMASPAADAPDDEAPPPGKCLFPESKTLRRGKAHVAPARWSNLKQGMIAGGGRLFYRLSAVHGADDHQSIQFYLGNALPVAGTVVARVILTSSDGSQQSEDVGLDQVAGRTTKTDESLLITPFEDESCITDVDVTEVHACPLPDDNADRDDSADIFRCNADAAAGTTTVNGITYISGREPKSLTVPPLRAAGLSGPPLTLAKAGN